MKTITVEGVEYVAVQPLGRIRDLARDLGKEDDVCALCPFYAGRLETGCRRCEADALLGITAEQMALGAAAALIPVDLLPLLKMRVPPGTLQHS